MNCPDCHGSGKIRIPIAPSNTVDYHLRMQEVIAAKKPYPHMERPCSTCGGSGKMKDKTPKMGDIPSITFEDILQAAQRKAHQEYINLLNQLNTDMMKQSGIDFFVSPLPFMQQRGVTPASPKNQLDEESRFERDWRSQMPRSWKGWSQADIDKQVAKVWLDEGKGVLCARFPYKQSAIDEFRSKIPKGKKAWNAEDKLWEFSVETIDLTVDILTRNFDDVIDLTQATSPSSVVVSGDPLLSLLDKDDIKAIYRVLANKYHPDKQGGDGDKMARINQIFGQIK